MKKSTAFRFRIISLLLVLFAAVFLLLACREGDARLYLLAAAVPGSMLILLLLPSALFALDRPSLSAALALSGFGILAYASFLPDAAVSQSLRYAPGLIVLMSGAVLVRVFRPSLLASFIPAFAGLFLLSFPFFVPGFSFSLAEGGLVLLLFSVSSFLSLRLRLPALIVSLCGLLLLMFSRDIVSASVCGLCFVLLFWAVSDSTLWSGIILLSVGGLLAVFSGFLPSAADTAARPVLSFSLILPEFTENLSSPDSLDSLFLLFGRQYGLIMLLCAVLFLILILVRGASLALHTRKSFHASLALSSVLLLGFRALFFLLSLSGLIPLFPCEFPLLTSSLPDILAHFCLLGFLSGVSARNETDLEEDMRLSMLAR